MTVRTFDSVEFDNVFVITISFRNMCILLTSCSSSGDGQPPTGPIPTSSLNPNRPPECLTTEIFELIGSQMKFIVGRKTHNTTNIHNFFHFLHDALSWSGLSHRLLIQNTAKTVIENFASAELAGGYLSVCIYINI